VFGISRAVLDHECNQILGIDLRWRLVKGRRESQDWMQEISWGRAHRRFGLIDYSESQQAGLWSLGQIYQSWGPDHNEKALARLTAASIQCDSSMRGINPYREC
jgi:hypothetical protein